VNAALRTALELGRVSNLPTVWTNVLAGVVLNGAVLSLALVIPLCIAISLLYVSGMYLNDAFDRRWDAQHRPERPIPAGEVSARTVFLAGFGLMAAGLLTLLASQGGVRTFLGGLALAVLIVLYDVSHKKNPFGPLLMGLCRVAVYVTAALAVSRRLAPPVYVGGSLLLMYLITLSLIARNETKNARLPRLVGMLIAGISLLDGAQVAILGPAWAAAVCGGAFVLTRLLHRRIAGT
jgi:4-hydroxybenzoate polyprenyltransferase